MEQKDHRFSRREIRGWIGWSDTALKVHLARLADMEYLLIHRGGRGQSFSYELLYQGEGEDGKAFLSGLIDVEKLKYDANRSGQNGHRSGSGQPPVRGQSGAGQAKKNAAKPATAGHPEKSDKKPQKRTSRTKNNAPSYRTDSRLSLAAQEA